MVTHTRRQLFAASALIGSAGALRAAPAPARSEALFAPPNENVLRWSRGSYSYATISTGAETGREDFMLTVRPDGSRTIRAATNIAMRGVQVDATVRVRADFRPLDAFVSIWTKGRLKGSAFYSFSADRLDVISHGEAGPATASAEIPENVSIAAHPLALDGWHGWYTARGPVEQRGSIWLVNGDADFTKPMLGELKSETFRYIGSESVTTPVGQVTANHIGMASGLQAWTFGPDRLSARLLWPAIDREYFLTSLQQGPNPGGKIS